MADPIPPTSSKNRTIALQEQRDQAEIELEATEDRIKAGPPIERPGDKTRVGDLKRQFAHLKISQEGSLDREKTKLGLQGKENSTYLA